MKRVLALLLTTSLMTATLSSLTKNSPSEDDYTVEQLAKYLQATRRLYPLQNEPLKNRPNVDRVYNVENDKELAPVPNAPVKLLKTLHRLIAILIDQNDRSYDPRVKRAYHALCHFKMCNMGSKRDEYGWWRNN